MLKKLRSVLTWILLSVVLAACSAALNSCGGQEEVSALADRDSVFIVRADGTEPLAAQEKAALSVDEGVDVDDTGRAILQFADLLTVEVLRNGSLTIQEVSLDEQNAAITVFQNGGVLFNDFNAEAEIEKRFTINTEFASISAVGTTFIVVKEPDSPLEWVVALDADPDDLEVTSTATNFTKDVQTNMARWIAPIGDPSAGITANQANVDQWLAGSQAGTDTDNFGDIVWPQADILADSEQMLGTAPEIIPGAGASYTVQNVGITLGDEGSYAEEDCNLDGIPDVAIKDGSLEMDFRNVLARVKALDVTVLVRSGVGQLTVLDPAREPIETQSALAAPAMAQVLTLRHNVPYHYAELNLEEGCFLGFSLTPPQEDEEPESPRSAVEQLEVAADFVRINEPFDGATVTAPLFIAGEASVPLYTNRELFILIETPDGSVIQQEGVIIEGGVEGGRPGTFSTSIQLDYILPAEVVVRVQNIRPVEIPVILAEDSVQITLNPEAPGAFRRPPENGEFNAPYLPTLEGRIAQVSGIRLDGDFSEWDELSRAFGVQPVLIDSIVFDQACQAFFPPVGIPEEVTFVDLQAEAIFAYSDEYLFAYFLVRDERYVPHRTLDTLIFQGDAPQIILDIDLPSDFDSTTANQDDIQIDLHPGDRDGFALYSPYGAYWNIGTFLQSNIQEASFIAKEISIASVPTLDGYALEAAIPWTVIGIQGKPGDVIGIAASVSDNDTPETNIQECMISSAPGRDFRDPTTWGTLFLMAVP